MQPLITEFEDSSLHLAHSGPLVLMNWRTEFNPGHIAKIEALHHRRAQHYETGIVGMNIVECACGLPSTEARDMGNDMMKRTASTTRAVVMVMLDQGFAASALSSIALRVLGLGGRVPIRSFRTVRASADWIHVEYPETPVPDDIADLVARLRVSRA